jgi:hypothetical protein
MIGWLSMMPAYLKAFLYQLFVASHSERGLKHACSLGLNGSETNGP